MSSFVVRLGVAGLMALSASAAWGQGSAPAVSAAAPVAKMPAPENKWRIECSEGAKSDGEIVFRVTPKDGASTDVTVAVKDGTSENNVADNIRDAFKAQLSKDLYTSEVDDGEDVLLKKRYGKPDFSLQLISNSVKGVRLDIERE